MKKALITGVLGQDGSYLAQYLLSLGYEVFGLCRMEPGLGKNFIPDVHYLYGDIRDRLALEGAILKAQPDEIYNLAGQVFVPISWTRPAETFEVNVGGLANILSILDIRKMTKTRVYQASSSEMFGNKALKMKAEEEIPMSEKSGFYPESPYGASKLAAHELVQVYKAKGFYVVSGILFNHESPRRGPEMVTRKITRVVAKWAKGIFDPLTLGNTSACRDWGYAGDYVIAMHRMMQLTAPEDFVVGTGRAHSVQQFVEAAIHAAGLNYDACEHLIVKDDNLIRPNDIKKMVADASKAHKKLSWKPTMSFNDLVKMMVDADIRHVEHQQAEHLVASAGK